MAKFEADGIDDTVRALERMNLYDESVIEPVLSSAADFLVDTLQRKAQAADHKRFGDMIRSIYHKKMQKDKQTGTYYITVSAKGKDRDGVQNGVKAFVLNYGRTEPYGFIKASYFWFFGRKEAEPHYEKLMTERLNSVIDENMN